jgi:hypothetical protein
MRIVKNFVVALISSTMILSGCQTTTGSSSGLDVGPQLSTLINKAMRIGKEPVSQSDPNRPKMDIVIPIFDPGLPEAGKEYETEGVWPELRRAEAIRFAHKLKAALEETEAFGAVRVTPDKTATGDIYILGKINESNGEDVEIELQAFDISGNRWMNELFDHEVSPSFHKNYRNRGKDPYDPVFEEAAKSIVEELSYHETTELDGLQRITDLRFGANFIEQAFAEHLTVVDGQYTLASFPSDSDPMLVRTKAIRVRDQLYVDGLQDNYRSFSDSMNTSYAVWQEQSLQEIEAKREADKKAAGEAVAGILLIGLAVAAVAAGADSNNYGSSSAAMTAGVVGVAAGAKFLGDSFQTNAESKVHRDALEELGESMDADLAPKVVAFEQQSVELSGTATEQFAQWREFLKRIYLQERTPLKQL